MERLGSRQSYSMEIATKPLVIASEIAGLAPLSLRYSKLALTSPDGTAELDEAFAACWNSADARESALARAERRPPSFRGA